MIRSNAIVLLSAVAALACGSGGTGGPAAPSTAASASPGPTIGPAGGTVTGPGSTRLVVPPGALPAPVALVLRLAPGTPLDPRAVGQSAVVVEPAGTAFAAPATLVIRYDPALGPSGVAEPALRLHALSGTLWTALAGAVTDAASHEASASVSAAGTFAVRWTGPEGACGLPQDGQFDFWLGSWNYLQGNLAPARNDITKADGGCVVEESFSDPTGTTARSVSLFSRVDGSWHQTYLDSRGERIVLKGGREGSRMVLLRSANDRFVWDPLSPDTIRFYEERSADGGATWSVVFDSRYTRRQ